MNIDEASAKFQGDGISFLLRSASGKVYSMGHINKMGGTCDGCWGEECDCSFYFEDICGALVVRVIEMTTGYTLYEDPSERISNGNQ